MRLESSAEVGRFARFRHGRRRAPSRWVQESGLLEQGASMGTGTTATLCVLFWVPGWIGSKRLPPRAASTLYTYVVSTSASFLVRRRRRQHGQRRAVTVAEQYKWPARLKLAWVHDMHVTHRPGAAGRVTCAHRRSANWKSPLKRSVVWIDLLAGRLVSLGRQTSPIDAPRRPATPGRLQATGSSRFRIGPAMYMSRNLSFASRFLEIGQAHFKSPGWLLGLQCIGASQLTTHKPLIRYMCHDGIDAAPTCPEWYDFPSHCRVTLFCEQLDLLSCDLRSDLHRCIDVFVSN